MPFYLAYTLPEQQAQALTAHLMTCSACRTALEEWRAIANATHHLATERAQQLPPLSAAFRQQIQQDSRARQTQRQAPSSYAAPMPRLTVMPRHAAPPPPLEAAAPMMPVTRRTDTRGTRRRTSFWLMQTAAVLVLVFAAGLVITLTRQRLLTTDEIATDHPQVAGQITATMTPVSSLVAGVIDATQETISLTSDEAAESIGLTATPWNTVMPIPQSATPTFTITPPAPAETIISLGTGQPQTTIPPPDIAEAGTDVIQPFTTGPTATRNITRNTEDTDSTRNNPLSETDPVVQRFSVVPNTVQPGQTVTVHWQTSGADWIEIAVDTTGSGVYRRVHSSDVSTDSLSYTVPTDIRDQISFELRLIQHMDADQLTSEISPETADSSTGATTLMNMTTSVTERVSAAVQCPYIYLLYGSRCPDAAGTQFTATVQRFENGWIIRRNDLGEGIVLWNNGTVATGAAGQPIPTASPPSGFHAPGADVAAFYQTALGWALMPPQQVQVRGSVLSRNNTSDPASQWFRVDILNAQTAQNLLSLELNWIQVSANAANAAGTNNGLIGNFSQWRSV